MKKRLLTLVFLFFAISKLLSQSCDIGITGYGFTANPIIVGQYSNIKFSIGNLGTDPDCGYNYYAPGNPGGLAPDIKVIISIPPGGYEFDSFVYPAPTSATTAVGPYFDWVYDAVNNVVIGTNNTGIPFQVGESNVTIKVKAIAVSANESNIRIVVNNGANNSNGINDAAKSTLTITGLQFTVTGNNTPCGATTGSVTISAPVGGIEPFSISGPGASLPINSPTTGLLLTDFPKVISGLPFSPPTKTYTIIEGSIDGYSGTASGTIAPKPVPTASITPTTATLNCINTSITLTGSGGGTYSWSDGTSVLGTSTTQNVTNPGTYTLTVTSANGCTATATRIVTNTAKPDPIITNATICSGATYTWAANNTGYTTTQTGLTITNDACTANQVLNLTVTPKPTVVVTNKTICSGETFKWTINDVTYSTTTSVTVINDGCTANQVLNLTVTQPVTPTFTQVAAICKGATLSALPTTSLNGITGTWSPGLNNMATTTYTFTPTAGQCANTATMEIVVNIIPTISGTLSACVGQSSTLTGTPVGGSWGAVTVGSNTAVAQIYDGGVVVGLSPSGLGGVANIYYFGANGCNTSVVFTVYALPATPSTGTYGPVCKNDEDIFLVGSPVGGVWSGTGVSGSPSDGYVFDPSVGTQTLTYTVTNSNNCTNSANTTITVINNTENITPVTACEKYTWPNTNQTYTMSGTYTGNISNCVTEKLELTITPKVTPTFTQVASICKGATLSALPTTSLNGITGTWSPELNNMATTTYTFTPTAGTCANTATMTITVNDPDKPIVACYETATLNTTTCKWEITGTQPVKPTLECYQSANFNTITCKWDVTGTKPAAPTGLACYETATFDGTVGQCKWVVTGTKSAAPTGLACYETATFDGTVGQCKWVVTGTQPVKPTLACYQTATFNTETCKWDVTGTPQLSSISGFVFQDFVSGNIDGTILTVTNVYISLFKSTNSTTVPDQVKQVVGGAYSFINLPDDTYTLVLGTNAAGSNVASFPIISSFFTTAGAEGKTGTIGDGAANGITKVTIGNCIATYVNAKVAAIGTVDFAIKKGTALPVRLITFDGKPTDKGNELNWKTSGEKNFSHFEVEKSKDAIDFVKIGKVNGAGNANENLGYIFLDEINQTSLLPGANTPGNGVGGAAYYRLKMVDKDASTEYSKVIYVTSEDARSVVGQFYPSPAVSNEANINVTSAQKMNWNISSFDVDGRLLTNETRSLEKGINKLNVNLLNNKPGIILFKIENAEGAHYRKIVKQ